MARLNSSQAASFRHIVRRNVALLAAEMRDDIICQGRYFGVGIRGAKLRHEDIVAGNSHVHALQNRLSHIGAVDIVDSAGTEQRRIWSLLALAVPLVATGASTLE